MNRDEVLAVDLGQSGTSLRFKDLNVHSPRGKQAGENTLDALEAVFESLNASKRH